MRRRSYESSTLYSMRRITGEPALQILLWPYSYSKQQIDAAEGAHAKVCKGRGKLMIRDLKLNALEPGERAGIDR